MSWLVLDLTGSVGQLGLMIFMMGLPMTLVSLWGGVLADRYDRRAILIAAQAFTGLNLFTLALLTETGLVATWHVYASSVGLGAMQAITMPARNAIIRSLVGPESMRNAVALNSVQMQVAQVVWPALAGIMIALVGVGSTLALSGALSISGIFCLLLVKLMPVEAVAVRKNQLRELIEGARYSFSAPPVSTLMSMAICVGFFGLFYTSVAPGYAREELGMTASWTGFFLMALGVGSILGSIFMLVVDVRDNLRAYFVGAAAMGASIFLVSAAPWDALAFLPTAAFGFCLATMVVSGGTLLQVEVPPHLLGRTTSFWSICGGIGLAASLPIGALGEVFGLRYSMGAAGLLLLLAVAFNGLMRTSVLRPGRKRSLAEQAEPTPSIAV
jgi:MFS family permease